MQDQPPSPALSKSRPPHYIGASFSIYLLVKKSTGKPNHHAPLNAQPNSRPVRRVDAAVYAGGTSEIAAVSPVSLHSIQPSGSLRSTFLGRRDHRGRSRGSRSRVKSSKWKWKEIGQLHGECKVKKGRGSTYIGALCSFYVLCCQWFGCILGSSYFPLQTTFLPHLHIGQK